MIERLAYFYYNKRRNYPDRACYSSQIWKRFILRNKKSRGLKTLKKREQIANVGEL